MVPTEEQKSVIETPIAPKQVLVIRAFAGAGKTAVLEMYAGRYPNKKFLYLAFNKSAQLDAEKRMPKNVVCKTTHAVAHIDYGTYFRKANKLGEPKTKDIMKPLGIEKPGNAIAVLATVTSFLHSAESRISDSHLPKMYEKESHVWKSSVLLASRKLWAMMQDLKSTIPMSHDGYLKLWQIECQERIPKYFERFDTILLDEAQDTNPAMQEALECVIAAGRHSLILVGDERQSINQWRGAVNMMGSVVQDIRSGRVRGSERNLTESFRFGPAIAEIATVVLNLHADKPLKLTGRGGKGKAGPQTKVILARTNAAMIAHAIDTIAQNHDARLHFAGTSDRDGWSPVVPYKFHQLRSVYALSVGLINQIVDPYIARFKDYADLQNHAQNGEIDIALAVKTVDKYRNELPELLDDLIARSGPPDGAICYSTAHRSKGLEWDDVSILDDFPKFSKKFEKRDAEGNPMPPSKEEGNLIYVAVTRARKHLTLNADLIQLLYEKRGKQQDAPAHTPAKQEEEAVSAMRA